MASRSKLTKKEHLQQVANAYIASGEPWPTDLHTVVRWALSRRLVSISPREETRLIARDMQIALREEYYEDPQGRQVRKKHAFQKTVDGPEGPKQLTFWCDIETGTPEQMTLAFTQRRRQIIGDCRQLKTDVDSWNENNGHGAHYQLLLNFEPDVVELDEDTEYNPPPPPPDDED